MSTAASLIVRTRARSSSLREAASRLEEEVWEPFGFLSSTRAHQRYYSGILDRFADLQLCLVDEETEEPAALANCVPFAFSGDLDALPQEGWDWLVETGSESRGAHPNMLGALAVSVPERHRGKGFARILIRALKELAIRKGCEGLVVPVRPTSKWRHPRVPMTDYMHWRDDAGASYDPWLRSHVSQGARIINACERSMVVEEHVAFWETWAGRRFQQSGSYDMAGALSLVEIDLERQTGRYQEPNVWVGYAI